MITNVPGLRMLQAFEDDETVVFIAYLGRRAFEIGALDGDPLKAEEYERIRKEIIYWYDGAHR